jgi:hypothetical protein
LPKLPHYPRSYSKLPTSKPRTHFCSEEGTGSKRKTKSELQNLSITRALSLAGSIVLCGCVLEAGSGNAIRKDPNSHHVSTFNFYWRNFAKKRNSQLKIWKGPDFGGFQSPKVRGKLVKSYQISIFCIQCVEKNIKRWLRFCTSYVVYSRIWPDSHRDKNHFFYGWSFFIWQNYAKFEPEKYDLNLLKGFFMKKIAQIGQISKKNKSKLQYF